MTIPAAHRYQTSLVSYQGEWPGPFSVDDFTVNGTLTCSASDATEARFVVTPGIAPSSPATGAIWATTAGLFYRTATATVGPLIDATLSGGFDIPDDQYLTWGTDSDIRARYDETTDDRLEFDDAAGNTLVYISDLGTTGLLGVTGRIHANEIRVHSGTTATLYNATATTVQAFGAATSITMGAGASATITLSAANILSGLATINLFNTTATTVNFGGVATAISIGATNGTVTFGNAGYQKVIIKGVSGVGRQLAWRTGTTDRWNLYADTVAESGADAGSGLKLDSYTDAGAVIDTVLSITRASGGTVAWGRPMSTTSQITSTLATGTAPFVVASTTLVANLNADLLDGKDWTAPGAIGGTTPGSGAFTTITASSTAQITGTLSANTIALLSGVTATLFNTTATTVNAFGAATTLTMGAGSGATITLSADTIVGGLATVTLWNGTSTTVNAFGAATTMTIGAGAATLNARFSTIASNQTTVALLNATTTTINFGGAATAINMGAGAASTLTCSFTTGIALNSAAWTTNQTTLAIANTTATTLNIGGAATAVNIGAGAASTLTASFATAIALNSAAWTTNQTTLAIANATATTINFGGAATTMSIGAGSATLNANFSTIVSNQTTVALLNATTTTLNIGGAATTVQFCTGTTTSNVFVGDGSSGAYTKRIVLNQGTTSGSQAHLGWYKNSIQQWLIYNAGNADNLKIYSQTTGADIVTFAPTDISLGSANTQTVTHVARMLVRSVTDAGPMTATAGTQREIVYNTSDNKFYGCTVTGSPATWAAFH